jgi:uncharacterized protein (TIGR02611 family)
MDTLRKHSKKVLVGIIGGLVTLVGFVLIPYPGPGWLVVFAGLALLATEFEVAAKLLHFLKRKYEAWTRWSKRQPPIVRAVVLAATGLVVVVTIWLFNGFGILNTVLGLGFDWLNSPLFR